MDARFQLTRVSGRSVVLGMAVGVLALLAVAAGYSLHLLRSSAAATPDSLRPAITQTQAQQGDRWYLDQQSAGGDRWYLDTTVPATTAVHEDNGR